MKKLFCFILLAAISLSLAACKSQIEKSEQVYEMNIFYTIEADWNEEFQNGEKIEAPVMTIDLATKFRAAVKELPEEEQKIIPDINKLFKYSPLMAVKLESGETVYIIHFIAIKFIEKDGEIEIKDMAMVTRETFAK